MPNYEVKVENQKGEPIYQGEVQVRSEEKAHQFADAVIDANSRNHPDSTATVTKK